ncbi:substrate-binding domain-containing protein, partial [Acinetobacter baumannii]
EEMEDHIAGFLDAVWDEGISYREECVQGYTNKQFITLLRNNPYIDGIVTESDKVTFELIQAAKNLNIRIPDKLKIIGLNGSI